jgi:hypothetical protein
MADSYKTMSNPYDNQLGRVGGLDIEMQPPAMGGGGTVENVPVKNEGAMDDVWIKNTIRSTNWKAKTVGFYIDGRTGYAEFANLRITQTISGLTLNATTINGGTITGSTINSVDITGTSTISGATITGGTFQTSDNLSDPRVIISGSSVQIYDAAGTFVGSMLGGAGAELNTLKFESEANKWFIFNGKGALFGAIFEVGGAITGYFHINGFTISPGKMFVAETISGCKEISTELLSLSGMDATAKAALTPANGDMIYNIDTNKIEAYVGGAWVTLSYT